MKMKEFARRHRLDLVGVGVAVLVGSGLMIFFNTSIKPNRQRSICQSNLKQIGLAFMQYSRDYDERIMLTNNWADALGPYSKSPPIFVCPTRPDLTHGYALHQGTQWMHGIVSVDKPAQTILVFESDAGTRNPSDLGTSLPKPARHPGGHSTLFFDGHVKTMSQPDLKFGYNKEALLRQKKQAEIESAKFWRKIEKREAQRKWLIEQQKKRKTKPLSTQ